jgi:O-antigen ligase
LRLLSYPTRILLLVCMLAAPWFWGAWEIWWFWPLAFGIFVAAALLGLRWVVEACVASDTDRRGRERGDMWLPALLFLPFLAYALVRFVQAEVRMDAERSLLLFVLPLFLAAGVLASFRRSDSRALLNLILADLFLLGLYGVWNHLRTGSQTILGRPGFPQYYLDDRASGPYFCPDHYAGLLELALCLALPILSVRDRRWGSKLFAILTCVLAILGIVLSKSRGGGLAVVVILAAWLAWGFLEWPARWRWGLRIVAVASAAAILTGAVFHKPEYVHRFVRYFGWSPADGRYVRSEKLFDVLRRQDRPQYWGAAYRAWREHPWTGIGPGMHQNLSPHYAATPDGDRKTGKWPTFPNYAYNVDMVHNDWLQLLEEYGAVGFLLFLLPAAYLPFAWMRQLYREGARARAPGAEPSGNMVPVCAALLATAAMAFHSLGDFNLQIPATGWLFAGILGVGWLHSRNRTEGIEPEAGARE